MFLTPRMLGETHVWDVFQYALGASLQKFPEIGFVGATVMANHPHYVVLGNEPVVHRFMADFHRDFSKAMCGFLEAEGYEAPDGIFDKRKPHVMRLYGASTQLAFLAYSRSNPPTAGLVASADAWPMSTPLRGSVRVTRPPMFFGKGRPDSLVVRQTWGPDLLQAFGDAEGVARAVDKLTRERAPLVRDPMGLTRASQLHPHSEPRTAREAAGDMIPSFALYGSDVVGLRADCARETTRFRDQHQECGVRLRAGETGIIWPHGTCKAVWENGGAMAPPHPDAILFKPCGPLVRTSMGYPEARRNAGDVEHGARQLLDEYDAERVEAMEAASVGSGGREEAVEVSCVEPMSAQMNVDARRLVVTRDRVGERPVWAKRNGPDPDVET